MCSVWIWEQTAIISLYSINWLVCVTERECVYCAVRTGSLYIILRSAHTVYLCVLCGSENKQRLFSYTALTDWICNWDGVCLLRGTDCIFIFNSDYLLWLNTGRDTEMYRSVTKVTRTWSSPSKIYNVLHFIMSLCAFPVQFCYFSYKATARTNERDIWISHCMTTVKDFNSVLRIHYGSSHTGKSYARGRHILISLGICTALHIFRTSNPNNGPLRWDR